VYKIRVESCEHNNNINFFKICGNNWPYLFKNDCYKNAINPFFKETVLVTLKLSAIKRRRRKN
jgi:hypothetical protein